jgi:ABC-type Fe2+-enterobactin transport system substrate-binding protein
MQPDNAMLVPMAHDSNFKELHDLNASEVTIFVSLSDVSWQHRRW